MSYACIAYVLTQSRQTGTAKLLLVAIADLAQDDGTGASPSIAALARCVGTGERNVQLALRRLEQAGELHCAIGAGPGGCNRYTIPGLAADDQPIIREPCDSPEAIGDSPEAIGDSPATGESPIALLRKEGTMEGGSTPAANGDSRLPPMPPGEVPLPAGPVELWRTARGAPGAFDIHQLQAFASAHDAPTGGFGRYWVGRAILDAGMTDPGFATNPRALNLVRAILNRWRNDTAYGSDAPGYRHSQEAPAHEPIQPQGGRLAVAGRTHSVQSTQRGPRPASDSGVTVACTIIGRPVDRG